MKIKLREKKQYDMQGWKLQDITKKNIARANIQTTVSI